MHGTTMKIKFFVFCVILIWRPIPIHFYWPQVDHTQHHYLFMGMELAKCMKI